MTPRSRCLTALPVYNERTHLTAVLDEVQRYAKDVLVVDDGSTDGVSECLEKRTDIYVETHPVNRGYGAALRTAFDYAVRHNYAVVVTIDCDGQHEPQRIQQLFEACRTADIASGSRYLELDEETAKTAPSDRRRINRIVTEELNQRLGLSITDAFCGFKAYRVDALKKLSLTEEGYAMPLELWVQAVHLGLRITEVPVPLIYLDEDRSFGGALDQSEKRLSYYREVVDRAIAALPSPLVPGVSREPTPLSMDPCLSQDK